MFSLDKINELSSYKIAVIGGGAAGVSFIHDLIFNLVQRIASPIHINVFDPGEMGAGLAYQDDVDSLLLNVRTKAMTVENSIIGSFKEWCNKKGYSNNAEGENYLPRYLFGHYLKELFNETVKLAAKYNIVLSHVKEEVIDLHKQDGYTIFTRLNKYSDYQFVMLATGNSEPSDNYNLLGKSGYINNPYPTKTKLNIPKNENVAILGSGLTAVDVVVTLIENKHNGFIKMYSRNGSFPAVKGLISTHTMQYLTQEELIKIIAAKKQIRLKDIYKLMKKELHSVDHNVKELFFHEPSSKNIMAYLSSEISNSCYQNPWQAIMIQTNHIIEEYWDKLNSKDKEIFLKHYHTLWMTKRCPMPLSNAAKIISALDSGQLEVVDNIHSIQYSNEEFIISANNKYEKYKFIVNSTGPSRNLSNKLASPLIKNLLHKGYINEQKFGGIQVDFDSAAIVDQKGEIDFNFRAIGHITCGTYYYTSSFIMISRKLKKISADVIKSLSNLTGLI